MAEVMTSLLVAKQPGGVLRVHDESISNNLLEENEEQKTGSNSKMRKISFSKDTLEGRPYSSPPENLTNVDKNALLDHTLRLKEWLNQKQVKLLQEKTDQEAQETKKMYNSVLGTEDTFVKDVSDLIGYKKLIDLRKREVLHKQWQKSVYRPIQREIRREMNSSNYADLSRRKRELHKEYIEHVNRKGHVFLDTIAPEEYYPMSLHPIRPSLLVAETERLRDPLLSQQRARSAEERVVFRCLTGQRFTDSDIESIKLPLLPLVPQGRHGTTSNTWLAMPLGDIESPVRQASRRRMHGNQNDSHFALDDWSKPHDSHVVDSELNLQRRRRFPMDHIKSNIAIFSQHKVDQATQCSV